MGGTYKLDQRAPLPELPRVVADGRAHAEREQRSRQAMRGDGVGQGGGAGQRQELDADDPCDVVQLDMAEALLQVGAERAEVRQDLAFADVEFCRRCYVANVNDIFNPEIGGKS